MWTLDVVLAIMFVGAVVGVVGNKIVVRLQEIEKAIRAVEHTDETPPRWWR